MMNQNRLLALATSLILVFLLSACAASKKTGITTEQNVVDEFADQVQIIDAEISGSSSAADAEAQAIADAKQAIADANKVTVDDQDWYEAQEQARRDAEDQARRDAEEQARRDAEEQARQAIADANAVTVDDDAPTKGLLNKSVPAGVPAYSVYFDFDKSSILPRFEEAVLAHADYLRANSQLRVEIQGNCDERGSREYNIALGNRRALAVKKALELLGVDGSRIDVTSYGSEKPRAMGHNENAWQENRRADFVY